MNAFFNYIAKLFVGPIMSLLEKYIVNVIANGISWAKKKISDYRRTEAQEKTSAAYEKAVADPTTSPEDRRKKYEDAYNNTDSKP